jgi:hypothetical protein
MSKDGSSPHRKTHNPRRWSFQLTSGVYAMVREHFSRNFVFVAANLHLSLLAVALFAGMGALPVIGQIPVRATSNGPFDFNDLPSVQLAIDLQPLMWILFS